MALAVTGRAEEDMERTITIRLSVPTPAWSIVIEQVYLADDQLWVVSRLSVQEGVIAPQVISTAEDSVKVAAGEELEVLHIIAGKSWSWTDPASEGYFFPPDDDALRELIPQGELLFSRPAE